MTRGNLDGVVLLSGGVDSTVLLALLRSRGIRCWTLAIDYGQTNAIEIRLARQVSESYGAEDHLDVRVDKGVFGSSALLGAKFPADSRRAAGRTPPPTYVASRNVVFLSMAGAWAESLGLHSVYIGSTARDSDHARDSSQTFFTAMSTALSLGAWENPVRVCAPLVEIDKSGVFAVARGLGVDTDATLTCYFPRGNLACQRCDACLARRLAELRSASLNSVDVVQNVVSSLASPI